MSLNGSLDTAQVLKGKIKVIPTIDKTLTKSGQCADAKAVGDALDKKISIDDIVDNLTTDDATKLLSAKQGVELKKKIDNLTEMVTELTGG